MGAKWVVSTPICTSKCEWHPRKSPGSAVGDTCSYRRRVDRFRDIGANEALRRVAEGVVEDSNETIIEFLRQSCPLWQLSNNSENFVELQRVDRKK